MRRAKTSLPISPTLLKHFAAATAAITICIALFADGSTTEAVKETVKQNEIKKTEVNLLGAHKLVNNKLKVAPTRSMPMEDPPLSDQDFSGPSALAAPPRNPSYTGGAMPLPSQYARPEDMLPGRQKVLRASKTPPPHVLTEQEIANLREASRIRSGASSIE